MSNAEDTLREVREMAKWGQLANRNSVPMTDVIALVAYLEDPEAQDSSQSDKIRHLEERLSQVNGKLGGQTKAINKLKKSLDDQDKLKANNRKLSRIANAAHALVNDKGVAGHRDDADDALLLDHPLYTALREECK